MAKLVIHNKIEFQIALERARDLLDCKTCIEQGELATIVEAVDIYRLELATVKRRDLPLIQDDADRLLAVSRMSDLAGADVGTDEDAELLAIADNVAHYDALKRVAGVPANDNEVRGQRPTL